jgi:hypothetical protein
MGTQLKLGVAGCVWCSCVFGVIVLLWLSSVLSVAVVLSKLLPLLPLPLLWVCSVWLSCPLKLLQ